MDHPDEKQHIFDKPRNVNRLLGVFYTLCGLLFVLDFVIHRHTVHSWENLWGFYAVYGFVGCVILVLIAAGMRTFLMRNISCLSSSLVHRRDTGLHHAPRMNRRLCLRRCNKPAAQPSAVWPRRRSQPREHRQRQVIADRRRQDTNPTW